MSNRFFVAIACISVIGCGSTPTSPTVASVPSKVDVPAVPLPPVVGTPAPVPVPNAPPIVLHSGPVASYPNCLQAKDLPDVVEWQFDNVPVGAKIDRNYAHGDTAGCEATLSESHTQDYEHLRVFPDALIPTRMIVQFDKNLYHDCRVQVDASFNGVNYLGAVINYGSGPCVPVPIPDPTVPPTPTPVPYPPPVPQPVPPPVPPPTPTKSRFQTDLICGGFEPEDLSTAEIWNKYSPRVLSFDDTPDVDPFRSPKTKIWEVCGNAIVDSDVKQNEATITVVSLPAGDSIVLSLTTYRKNGVSFLPQTFFDGVSITITAPGMYHLTVRKVD